MSFGEMSFGEMSFALGRDELRRLDRLRKGYRILCARGALWVTFDHDPKDYLLGEGESLASTRRKGIILYALTASEVRLLPIESEAEEPGLRHAELRAPRSPSRRISVPLEDS